MQVASPPDPAEVQHKRPWYQSSWLLAAVSLGVLFLLFRRVSLVEIDQFASRARWPLVILALAFFPVDRVFMAWKWLLLIRTRVPGLRLATAVSTYYIGGAAGTFLPIGGLGPDAVRVMLLRRAGVGLELSTSSILVERLIGLLASAMMVVLSIVLMAVTFGGFTSHPELRWVAALSGGASGLGMLLLCSPRLRRGMGAEGWMKKIFARVGLGRHWQATLDYGDHQALLIGNLVLSFIEQLAPVIAFYICCMAFRVPAGLLQCLVIVPVAAVLERLPISFAGLGMREAGIVYMGGLFGLPYADALLVSVANEVLYLTALVPAAFFLWRTSSRTAVTSRL